VAYNKSLKQDKKQLVFAPSSLILTNYFLPLNEALGLQGKYVQITKFAALTIFALIISGCSDQPLDIVTCSGAVKQGSVWVSISNDNQVKIGNSQFSESLLRTKHRIVKQSCESVTVIIQAESSAKDKVVFDTIQTIKSLGYQVSK
jgi:biopolymer transport protein ExbD